MVFCDSLRVARRRWRPPERSEGPAFFSTRYSVGGKHENRSFAALRACDFFEFSYVEQLENYRKKNVCRSERSIGISELSSPNRDSRSRYLVRIHPSLPAIQSGRRVPARFPSHLSGACHRYLCLGAKGTPSRTGLSRSWYSISPRLCCKVRVLQTAAPYP